MEKNSLSPRKKTNENKQYIMIRYSFIIAMMILFAGVITASLIGVTVVNSDAWNAKADQVLTRTSIIPPERGRILADDGSVLAANLQVYTVRIDWRTKGFSADTLYKYLPALCDSLHAFAPSRTAEQWKSELLAAKQKGSRSYPLFREVSFSEYMRVRTFPYLNKKSNRTGLYAQRIERRRKPYGSMASRSIGSVRDTMIDGVQIIHGRNGIEMALDSLLFGQIGQSKQVQITSGIVKSEDIPAIKGYDVTTTINITMQDLVESELYKMVEETNANWGTCVLMEVQTGEIKAISNFERTESGSIIEGSNNAVRSYELGSVMKTITMMAALESGAVTDIETPLDTRPFTYHGSPIGASHGNSLSPKMIIAKSSNTGIVHMADRIIKKFGDKPDSFRQFLAKIGFFEPFNSGIAGESNPSMPVLGTRTADYVQLSRMSYGYSFNIQPLRVLGVYNAIANNGVFVRPHLVSKLTRDGKDSVLYYSPIREQLCSPENAAKLREMLHEVVWGEGTARVLRDDNVEIAGKTGTALMIVNGAYDPSHKRYSFCGFFPYNHPKYSMIVTLEKADRGAAYCSGMVIKNVAQKLHAKGWLDNMSDYAKGNDKAAHLPTFLATFIDSRVSNLRRGYNIASATLTPKPESSGNGVPNVLGLGAREAVAVLEKKGLMVKLNGYGHVTDQSIKPGTEFKRGDVITLKMQV